MDLLTRLKERPKLCGRCVCILPLAPTLSKWVETLEISGGRSLAFRCLSVVVGLSLSWGLCEPNQAVCAAVLGEFCSFGHSPSVSAQTWAAAFPCGSGPGLSTAQPRTRLGVPQPSECQGAVRFLLAGSFACGLCFHILLKAFVRLPGTARPKPEVFAC